LEKEIQIDITAEDWWDYRRGEEGGEGSGLFS